MIKVTVGNNVKRESVIIDESTTLRACLEANGVDYTRGVMHLDGSSLNPGDLDKTFDHLGTTEKCPFGRLFLWGIGGTGRRCGLKIRWCIPYRFDSDIPHHITK